MRNVFVFVIALLAGSVNAATNENEVTIKVHSVADGIYMLEGNGGNIGVSVGDDGVFIIDDQFAPLSNKIKSAIATLTDRPVRFVVNTHWHFDHTGGNENFGRDGAIIVAHSNVRKRMRKGQVIAALGKDVPPAPRQALPVITFEEELTFHWNGQTLQVRHPAQAHTDGDVVIYFVEANAVHAGDLYFNGFYPFIDVSSGGSIEGVIAGVDNILAQIDSDTRVIPGHGPLSNKAELQAYRDMLVTTQRRLEKLLAAGKGVDEIIAAKPIDDLEADWGDGFLSTDKWLRIVLESMR